MFQIMKRKDPFTTPYCHLLIETTVQENANIDEEFFVDEKNVF